MLNLRFFFFPLIASIFYATYDHPPQDTRFPSHHQETWIQRNKENEKEYSRLKR